MQNIHSAIVIFHIICGAISLLLFWGPCLSKKGGKYHNKIGNIYLATMTLTSVSGVVSSSLVLLAPLLIFPTMPAHFESVAYFLAYLQGQYIFLLMLSLLVWNNVRHAKRVLSVKANRAELRNTEYLWLPCALFIVASIALYQGIKYNITLTQIFAPLALFNCIGIARYAFKKDIAKGEWVIQHIGHIIGSGIGAYTAFFAFGGRSLFQHAVFENLPLFQIGSWVLPSLIGVPFIVWLSRKYFTLFNPVVSSPSLTKDV